jgi:hypothetical protein
VAKIEWNSNQRTKPPLVAEFMDEDTLVSGGAKVDATAFPAVSGKVHIPFGTLVGRTEAERTAKTGFGPADVTNDFEIFLTAFDVTDANRNNDVELLRLGTHIYEDRVQGWSGAAALVKTKIRELYQCILSVDAQG